MKWISVEKKRPRSGDAILFDYLDIDGIRRVTVGWLETWDVHEDPSFYSLEAELSYPDEVRYWMPLPKPPKDNSKQIDE